MSNEFNNNEENNQEVFNALDNEVNNNFDDPVYAPMEEANLVNEKKAILDATFIESFNDGDEDITNRLSEKTNTAQNFRSKEEFFKDAMNKHNTNKNKALINTVNNAQYPTPSDAEAGFNTYENNKVEIKDEYTTEEINSAKYETLKLVGGKARSKEDLADYIFSQANIGIEGKYRASERLNDLAEKSGKLNKLSSFASHMFVVRPLSEALVGDISYDNVKSDIAKYQSIEDRNEKVKFAVELTDKWYTGTNENDMTTAYLISQLNNPFYEDNLDDDVFAKTLELTLGGVISDIADLSKFGISASKKLSKSKMKGAKNSYKEITKVLNRDAINGLDEVGNTEVAGKFLGNVIERAGNDTTVMNQLEELTGLDRDTITQLSSVSDKEELEALMESNSKLSMNYESAAALQSHLRTIESARVDIDFDQIVETEIHRKGLTEREVTDFENNKAEQLKAEAVNLVSDYNDAYDIKTNLIKQKEIEVYEGISKGDITKTQTEKMIDNKLDQLDQKQVVELNINAVQPFAVIQKDSVFDLVRGADNFVANYLLSPQNTLKFGVKQSDGRVSNLTDDLTVIRNQQQDFLDKADKAFTTVAKSYNKLNKKERTLVENIIQKGDEYTENNVNIGKVYNRNELLNLGANDKVIDAYTKYRIFADEELKLNNAITRDSMVYKGYNQFDFDLTADNARQMRQSKSRLYNIVDDSMSLPGIKFDDINRKNEILNKFRDSHVLVEGTGEVVPMSALSNDLETNDIIKLVDSIGLNGKPVSFILSNKQGRTLPEWVIQRRKGYAARKYEANYYIYKINEYGNQEVVSAVARQSDVEKEMNKLINKDPSLEGNLSYREEGVSVGDKSLESEFDVNLSGNLSFSNGIRKKELLKTSDDSRVRTKPPFQALMDQVKTSLVERPVSEYRAASLKRLKETIKVYENKYLPENRFDSPNAADRTILVNPANVLEGIRDEFKNLPEFKGLQKHINYINKQMVDPSSKAFQLYSEGVRKGVNLLDKKLSSVLPEKINNKITTLFDNKYFDFYDLEKSNPAQTIKTLNFIRMLGLFNPKQLILQSMQTTSILSISPKHGAQALIEYSMYKLMRKNFRKNPDALNDIIKKAKLDRNSLDNAILDLDNSNYLNGISNNADLVLQDHGVFSSTKRAANTIIDKGMYFYDLGNETVYATAFLTARRELLKGANRRLTMDELALVQERANKLAFNFTSANRSGFQEGLSGMATQFLQVPAKAYESLFSSQFTTAEKLRLLAGQTAFLGYAAVPIGEQFVGYLANELSLSEEQVVQQYLPQIIDFENGFVGNTLSSVFGYEITTDNLALFGSGIRDIPFAGLIQEMMESDSMVDSTAILKEFLGPSYSTLQDGASLLGQVYDVLDTIAFKGLEEGYKFSRDTLFDNESALVKFFSTSNNLAKAIAIYETGIERDKWGNVTKRWEEDEQFGRSVGAFFGLQSLETHLNYKKSLELKKATDIEGYIEEVSNQAIKYLEQTGDINGTNAMLYAECNSQNLDPIFCTKIFNKVQVRRARAALGLDLESRNQQKMIDSYKVYANDDEAQSNRQKLLDKQLEIIKNKN